MRETAFNLTRTYDDFIKQLETNYPEYFNLKFNAASPSSSELQARMGEKTAVLSYFIDDKTSHLYIFLITPKKFRLIDRQISPDFDKYITGLRNGLFFNDEATFMRATETLSVDLVPNNIPASVNDLVIIPPTGRLSIVPFETLFSKKPDANSSRTS